MALSRNEHGSRTQSIADDLVVLVMKDRLIEAGHVDLPGALMRSVSIVKNSEESNSLARVMVAMCRKVRNEYGSQYQEKIAQMGFTPSTGYGQFCSYVHESFQGGVSYSKIVALYSFAAELANVCMNDPARLGPKYVASILSWHLRSFKDHVDTWLIEHGGWRGFEDAFKHCVDITSTMRSDPIFPPSEASARTKQAEQMALRMVGVTAVTLGLAYMFGS